MERWVVDHSTELNVVALFLSGLAFLFGGQALGRFPALKRQGGFYAAFLAAIPTALMVGAIFYLLDYLPHFFLSNSLNEALSLTMDPVQLAIVLAILVGFLPSLAWPTVMKEDRGELISRGENAATFAFILPGILFWDLVLVAMDVRVATLVFRWPIDEQLSIPIVLIGTAVFFVSTLLRALGEGQESDVLSQGHESLIPRVPGLGGNDLESVDLHPPGNLHVRPMSGNARIGHPRIRKIFFNFLYGVGCLVNTPFVLLTIVVTGYIVYSAGWGILLYFPAVIVGTLLIVGLRIGIDKLSAKALTVIFAVPGIAAATIGFVTNFPSVLNGLP